MDTPSTMSIEIVGDTCKRFTNEVSKVVVGCRDIIQQTLIGMLVDGHLLLESVPGLGKTTLANTVAGAMKGGRSGAFQGTADMLPMDLIGSMVWNPEKNKMELQYGFVRPEQNVLLADEINRLSPKTAGALLSVMQERKLLIPGREQPMADPFLVIATQNPIEQEGTYPLPEALLDRFAMMSRLDYLSAVDEFALINNDAVYERDQVKAGNVQPVLTTREIVEMREFVTREVVMTESMMWYALRLARATRPHGPEASEYKLREVIDNVRLGASQRAGLWLVKCSKAHAALRGSKEVSFEDVRAIALPVLRHRMILKDKMSLDQSDDERTCDIFEALLEKVPTT